MLSRRFLVSAGAAAILMSVNAAGAFAQPTLQDRFAVAVSERGNALVTEGLPR